MIRILAIVCSVCALLSLFWFPYPYTVLLSFAASLFFYPVGFLIGFLADLLYSPALFSTWPIGTSIGVAVSVCAYLVGRFIEARIIRT